MELSVLTTARATLARRPREREVMCMPREALLPDWTSPKFTLPRIWVWRPEIGLWRQARVTVWYPNMKMEEFFWVLSPADRVFSSEDTICHTASARKAGRPQPSRSLSQAASRSE